MKNTITGRLNEYFDIKGYSVRSAEAKLKLGNGTLGKILKRGGDIKPSLLNWIIKEFNDLNPDWLETGEGPMFKDTSELASQPNKKPDMTNESLKDRMIENLLDQVKKLEEELQQYKSSTPKSKEAS